MSAQPNDGGPAFPQAIDRAMQAHRQFKVGDTVQVLVGSRRGHHGTVREVLMPPTPTHAWTGLARYGVEFGERVADYSRVELRAEKKR